MIVRHVGRHDAGHERGILPMQPIDYDSLRLGLLEHRLQTSAVAGTAIDRHAKRVVIFAEVRVLGHPAAIALRIEAAGGASGLVEIDPEEHLAEDRYEAPELSSAWPLRRRRLEPHGAPVQSELRSFRRHRMAAARLRLGDPDDVGRDFAEGSLRCVWRRRDKDGENDAEPGFDRRPSAGKARQIRPDSARGRFDGDAAGLQLSLGIAHASAGEHRVDRLRRRGVARHAHVVPGGADGGDRHHADAEVELQFFRDEVRSRGHCGARRSGGFAGNGEHRPVAAEHKGEGDASERIADSANDSGARHVDVLVAASLQRIGRFDDIGSANLPVIGEGGEDARVADALESVEDRQILVAKAVAQAARLALRARFLLEPEQLLRLPEALQAMRAHRAPEFWLDRRDFTGGKHARAERLRHLLQSRHFDDRRADGGKREPLRHADIAVHDIADVEADAVADRLASVRYALVVDFVCQHQRLVERFGDLAGKAGSSASFSIGKIASTASPTKASTSPPAAMAGRAEHSK